jgi:3-hydroxyacyl-[acyl-carrier-protein] dehydratase
MPLNDFFTYQVIDSVPDTIKARISINTEHPLYKGHFPQQPVTPGVVLVEIIRNVLSSVLKKQLMLESAKEIKFTAAVLPAQVNQIDLNIEYFESVGKISANCILSEQGRIFAKLKGEFCE